MSFVWILAWANILAAQPSPVAEAPGDQIINFRESDPEMNKAKAAAIASLPAFFGHFDKPAADETEFMVKYDVDPTDGVEFVWATLTGHSGPTFQGVLINQPEFTDDKLDDRVIIRQADVVDWGFRKSGVMQGSYTTRVMLAHMPEAEAAEYRSFLGW